MRKIMFAVLFLLSSSAFAGGIFNFGNLPPAAMLGPFTATKTQLADFGGEFHFVSLYIVNTHTAVQYLQFFDQPCANVTLGTTRATIVFVMPPTSQQHLVWPAANDFWTPVCFAATTTPVGAVGATANTVFMQVFIP